MLSAVNNYTHWEPKSAPWSHENEGKKTVFIVTISDALAVGKNWKSMTIVEGYDSNFPLI